MLSLPFINEKNFTTHQVMSPLEFMQRLAALVPRPRLHLIRFHGVLAPNAKLRAKVVPRPREEPAQGAPSPEDTKAAQGRPMRRGVGEATEAGV
jgi:Putative transposase